MGRTQRFIDLLSNQFPNTSRKELYAAIMCGECSINEETIRDPSKVVPSDSMITWDARKYVSRGGVKLDYALTEWDMDVSDLGFLDAGASTGGFTDCLLQHGALFVHSVDVGYNQLAWKLRSDPRVRVHERSNIMEITVLDPQPDAAVADLSFRSLRKAVSRILELTRRKWCVALIKPQFELITEDEDFDGVIRDSNTVHEAVKELLTDLGHEGVFAEKILPSPITGRKGNIELLALFRNRETIRKGELLEMLEKSLEIKTNPL